MLKLSDFRKKKWFIHKDRVRTDYVVIENLSQWLIDKVPNLHPAHPEYIKFWSIQTKRCIEGKWGKEFGKFRYMPGNLYYFGNFGIIQHSWIDERGVKVTEDIKPFIVDFIWDYAYQSMVCKGFSGFTKDYDTTCHYMCKNYHDGKLALTDLPSSCLKKDGTAKNYEDPWTYINKLHNKRMGKALFSNPTVNNIILGCLQGDVEVRMYDGSTKKAKNIQKGDLLMGPDNTPRLVKSTFTGNAPMFQVESRYGDPFICTDTHQLYTKRCYNSKPISTQSKSLCQIADDITYNKTIKHCAVQSKAIEYPKQDFILDPYWLGLWLGNGFKREKLICGSYKDKEILDWLINYSNNFSKLSYSITDYQGQLGKEKLWRFRLIHSDLLTKNNWFSKTLKNNKHVPEIYKICSREQRLKLLAGVIDSDGNYRNDRFTITNTDLNLLKDIQEVARSLGFKAKIHKPSISGIANSLKYNLRITGKITQIPTLLKRKQAIRDSKERGKGVNINEIKIKGGVGVGKFYGFEVDKDHLYLLKDYTITHNSRGGAKSYWAAIGEVEYHLVFGNAQRYDEKFINNESKCEQCVGSASVSKSAEMLEKFEFSQKCKTDSTKKKFKEWFGIWVETNLKGEQQVTPCPFYKHHVGNLDCPNKDNKYTAVLKQKINGKWVESGVGSSITHVSYSPNKGAGERAAEGGRYAYSDVEEVGSAPNFVEILGANEGTLTRGGVRIGFQSAQGTSGNIEYVQAAKKVFLNPRDYNILPYRNKFSAQGFNGEIGYFIPYYITLFQFKDKNGNTNYKKAFDYVNTQRAELSKSKDPKVLRDFLMNKPCYVKEMWSTLSGYYLPYEEASERDLELMHNQMYKKLGTDVELRWKSDGTVKPIILHESKRIDQFPLPKDLKDPSGCIVIYEWPEPDAPNDQYLFCHDPYIEENIDAGGSLGVTYVIKSPKYISNGRTGNIIVASYIGKPIKGLEYYYEQQEKLLAFYGNPQQGLWYEKNRGEMCREYYIRKGKQYLLCLTPQYTKGANIYQQNIRSFGFLVGNLHSKLNLLKITHDWLLEETEFMVEGKSEIKKNIFRNPCKFLNDQIMNYDIKENFDGVSAFLGGVLGLKERHSMEIQALKKKKDINLFENLLSNNRIFKQNKRRSKLYSEKDLV